MGLLRGDKIVPREYQLAIAERVAERGNSLVVLPTGLGKTLIALLVMEKLLGEHGRALVLAPTRPLAEQHAKTMLELTTLGRDEVVLLTGEKKAEKRQWNSGRIIAATPQTAYNDLLAGRLQLQDFVLVVFDEAHRAVGNYAYTALAQACRQAGVRALGLTASPGGREERIREVAAALGAEHFEIRTESDADVAPYVKPLEIRVVEVELPEAFNSVKQRLEDVVAEGMAKLTKLGYWHARKRYPTKRELLELREKLLKERGGRRFQALSAVAMLFNLVLALELLETQSPFALREFFRKMAEREAKSKAVSRLLADARVREAIAKADELGEHPKMAKLREIVADRVGQGKTLIVFTQYRDQVRRIVEALRGMGVKAAPFVGKREGVSEREQMETIEKFRAGEHAVLVASSIGEEGLDIPSVDVVVFYEPIPSEIRSIQRRGRAGRAKAGEVIVLLTKGTRDEAFWWSARSKERKMRRIMRRLQEGVAKAKPAKGQAKLSDFL
ncbi:MAG: helicase-related protein [Candidatus Micrarchaeia archaeon]